MLSAKMDLGSVGDALKIYFPLLRHWAIFIFSTGARAQARKLVGGWARRAQAKIKVDKQEKLYIMGYYEN